MKKLFVLVLALLFSVLPVFSSGAMALNNEMIQSYYIVVKSAMATLTISGGTANCSSYVKPDSSATRTSITMSLKQLKSGSWMTIATWTGSGQGTLGASASGSKSVASGYSYKVVATGTVKDLNGKTLETVTKESSTKTY